MQNSKSEFKKEQFKEEFKKRIKHCLKSALRQAQGGERSRTTNESKFWLELLIDAKKCNTQEANKLLKEVSEIASIFASSILTLPSTLLRDGERSRTVKGKK